MHGKLIKWKDDKGFGFIRCEHNQQEVFVHISAFPTSSSPRPKVGELLDFDIETTADGKTRAINISRAASIKTKTQASTIKLSKMPGKKTKKLSGIIVLLVIGLIVASVSQKFTSNPTPTQQIAPSSSIQTVPEVDASQFTCDGRTHCSEMNSCAEANYFLKNCPDTKMDGNNDGVPCEKQHCGF